MSDSQTDVSKFDVEVLLARIANLKHIWSNQDSRSDGEQAVIRMEGRAENIKSFAKRDPPAGQIKYSFKEQKSEMGGPGSMDRDKKGKIKGHTIRAQTGSDNSRMKKISGNKGSFTVTINSKDDMAASTPLGFRDIILDSSNKGRKKGNDNEDIDLEESCLNHPKPMVCNFCKNNREVRDIYLTHYLYDPVTKILSCPVLRKHICEICGDTGDNAHTLQYCRLNRARGGVQGNVPKMLCSMSVTNSAGKIRKN